MAKRKSKADISNEETYQMYYQRLIDYALSMFEWTGLPEEINVRFLELTMLQNGSAVFFRDKEIGGYMALPVTPRSMVNHYLEPTSWEAVSINYNKELDPDDSVIMWNNFSRTSILPTIRQFATRLFHVERSMDANIQQQKFPVVFLTDDSQRLTMQNLMEQFEGYEPFIMGNKKGFDMESVKAITTGIPFIADKLMEYKHNLWNEAMTFLGIGNAKQDKKERLVSDEVSANDEQIESSRYVMLRARQDACEKINAMFGLNVTVDFKLNADKPKLEEGDDDGTDVD